MSELENLQRQINELKAKLDELQTREHLYSGDSIDLGNYNLYGETPANIADDAAISFTPDKTYGALLLYRRYYSASATQVYALALYRVADPVRMQLLLNGTSTEATTGALAGTTGSDGKTTISAHTDGKIYIENRMGAEISVHYVLFGA